MKNRILICILVLLFALGCPLAVFAEEADYDVDYWEAVESDISITDDQRYYYYTNPETGYVAVVEDDADRLTDDEEYSLLYYMSMVTDFGSAYYKSISKNPYHDADDYAKHYLNDEKGCYGGGSGTVFLDDTQNRRLEIFSNGTIYKYVTKGKAVSITDNVYRYASNGQYYDCAAEVFDEMSTLLYGGKIAEPMKHTGNFFFSIIISLMLCFIAALWTSTTSKATVSEVMNALSKDLSLTKVSTKLTHVTREYDPPSSSSSGDGGGGGGGGGGGHSY